MAEFLLINAKSYNDRYLIDSSFQSPWTIDKYNPGLGNILFFDDMYILVDGVFKSRDDSVVMTTS